MDSGLAARNAFHSGERGYQSGLTKESALHAYREVGFGDKGRPKLRGSGFQDGAAWLFRHIREGGRVKMNYAVSGWPATDYYLVLPLSDEQLEELGLIEAGITERDDDTPWRKDYAEGIYKFLLANGEQLREVLGAETSLPWRSGRIEPSVDRPTSRS